MTILVTTHLRGPAGPTLITRTNTHTPDFGRKDARHATHQNRTPLVAADRRRRSDDAGADRVREDRRQSPRAPHPTLSDEPVTLSFTWWGNDVRHEITEELIAAFEAEHENITIEPQYTDWAGYWDKLATTVAAGDAPDIIQMDEKQLSTYAANGVLLDLGTLGDGSCRPRTSRRRCSARVPSTACSTASRSASTPTPTWRTSTCSRASASTLPDDETWSWDDFTEIAEEVTAASGGAVVGSQSWGFEDGGLNNWLRQHGESLYAEDGSPEVTASEETLAAWWQNCCSTTTEAGGTPDPSATIERESAGLAESFTATNQSAFGPWWSNQVAALRERERSEPRAADGADARRGRERGGVLQAVDVLVGLGQDRAPRRGRAVPRLALQQRGGGRPAARRARCAREREDPRVHHAQARRGQPGGRRLPRRDRAPRRRRPAGDARRAVARSRRSSTSTPSRCCSASRRPRTPRRASSPSCSRRSTTPPSSRRAGRVRPRRGPLVPRLPGAGSK